MSVPKSVGKILKGTGVVLVSSLLGKVLMLLGQVLMVRNLPTSVFGLLAVGYTIASISGNIGTMGVTQAIARFVGMGEEPERRKGYIGATLLITATSGLVFGILVFTFRNKIEYIARTESLATVLPFFAIFIVFMPLMKAILGILRGLEHSTEAMVAREFVPYITGILILSTGIYLEMVYPSAIIYWVSIPVLTLVTGVVLFWVREGELREQVRWPSNSEISELWTYSWPLALEGGLVILILNMDILMVGYFLSSTSAGLYKAVQPLSKIVIFLMSAFVFVYLPIATKFHEQGAYGDLQSIYKLATKWVVLLTFPLVLVLVVQSNLVIEVLYSKTSTAAALALSILTLGMFFRVVVGPTGETLRAIGTTRIVMFASFCGVVVNFATNVLLIPRIGIAGAAVATSIAFVVYSLVEVGGLYYQTRIKPLSRNAILTVLVSGGVVTTASWILEWTGNDLFDLLYIGIIYLSVHLAIIVSLGSLGPEDIVLVESIEEQTGLNLHRLKEYLGEGI